MKFDKEPQQVDQSEIIARHKIERDLTTLGVVAQAELIDHFTALELYSEFNHDSRMICEGVKNLLEILQSIQLKTTMKMKVILAVYLHDIGKSSSSMNRKVQSTVTKLFAVEGIKDTTQKVTKTLQLHFPAKEVDPMILNLIDVDVYAHNEMRDFWNKHAIWTKEILDRHIDIIEEDTRKIAASHHIDTGINPYGIEIDNPNQVSNEVKFSIFLLMAMDKYQAAFRRENEDHKKAMLDLKQRLRGYVGNPIVSEIIDGIHQLGSSGALFPESFNAYKSSKTEKSSNIIN